MALNETETLLVEAIQSMLGGKAKLGLAHHNDANKDESNTFQFLHENIQEQFDLDTIDSDYHTSLCSAFRKVHSYKYVTDPTFNEALGREFKAMGIPEQEHKRAFDAIEKIINEVKGGKNKWWSEKDSGWHPQLDEIIAASQPEQYGA